MLRTLIESRTRKPSNRLGAGASAGVHAALIILAAHATAAGAPSEAQKEPANQVIWVRRTPSAKPAVPHTSASRATTRTSVNVRRVSLSLAISPNLPDVEIPLGSVRPDDFATSANSTESSATHDAGGTGTGNEKTAYNAYDVDKAVSALPGAAPAYPSAMRSAGIEGEVRAEFVVDESGRADVASLRIVSATNDQFATAVRHALPKMRFAPAELHGRAVPQLVQQLFAFRLSR